MFRVYFVDDEPLVLEEIVYNPLFAESGFQTVGFSTDPGKAAKEIRTLNPDAVFTDLKMPERSGVDMMADLRENGAACEFIVISAYPDFEESRRFFLLDGFDYLIKPVSDNRLRELLVKLAGKLAGKKQAKNIGPDTASQKLNMIIAYLRERSAAQHTVESLCERFHLSRSYFSQLFANHLGTTFVAYMTKLRMEEAARLLKDSLKDVKEIAALCGYKDYFYFCRVFRNHHACTPTAFREGRK